MNKHSIPQQRIPDMKKTHLTKIQCQNRCWEQKIWEWFYFNCNSDLLMLKT